MKPNFQKINYKAPAHRMSAEEWERERRSGEDWVYVVLGVEARGWVRLSDLRERAAPRGGR